MARLRLTLLLLATVVCTSLAFGTMVRPAEATKTWTSLSGWYGGPCDNEDNNVPRWMPHDKNQTPGIALRRYDTPRKFFLLTVKRTNRRVVVRHTDYGPAAWTGRNIDINYTAIRALGYSGCGYDYNNGLVKYTLLSGKKKIRHWVWKTKTKADDKAFLK